MAASELYRIHEYSSSLAGAKATEVMMKACGIKQCKSAKCTMIDGMFVTTGSTTGAAIKKFFAMRNEVQSHVKSLDDARKHLFKHNLITECENARIEQRMLRRG